MRAGGMSANRNSLATLRTYDRSASVSACVGIGAPPLACHRPIRGPGWRSSVAGRVPRDVNNLAGLMQPDARLASRFDVSGMFLAIFEVDHSFSPTGAP
jgi:hypothetical protein